MFSIILSNPYCVHIRRGTGSWFGTCSGPSYQLYQIWHPQDQHEVEFNITSLKPISFIYFLHDRPWTSPWIKSISNESLFPWSRHNCLVIVTSSAIDCYVIGRTKTERVRYGDDVKRSSFLSSFLNSLCRNVQCYFGIYFPRCFATREINIKITLSWALKQFVTRIHTLFSFYI